MSNVTPTPESSPELSGTPNEKPPSRRGTIIVIAVAVAIVAGPLLVTGLPTEIANWHLANANVKQRAGDIDGAVASIEKAIAYAPEEPTVHLISCQILREAEQYEQSLAAVDRALELAPENTIGLFQKGATFMEMERFSDAVAVFEQAVDPDWSPATSTTSDDPLNTLAYARSLAGENLDQALKEINQAIERNPAEAPMSHAAKLDTRGFILHQLGKQKEALEDLDAAIANAEPELRRIEHLVADSGQSQASSQRQRVLEQSRKNLAVMVYHRGLIHKAMGNQQLAESDFEEVRELGEEPDESLF